MLHDRGRTLLGWLQWPGIFVFYKSSRPTVMPNQTQIERVTETSTPYRDGAPPFGVYVKNEGSCISTPLYAFITFTGTILPFTFLPGTKLSNREWLIRMT